MIAPSRTLRFAPFAVLLALCAMLHLPGLAALPVTDRDEARFAQATRQMIETGDYISINFQDEPRHKKPIGIHWAQALSVSVFRPFAGERAIWPYRVPSALGATLAVLLCFVLLRPFAGDAASLLAAALLASCLLLVVESHLATTDALLLATIVAAQGSLMRRLLRPDDRPRFWSLLFWIAQALGILIKGPVAPLISILTLLAWRLSGSRFRPLTLLHWHYGLPAALLILAPWIIAVLVATGGTFLRDAWLGDLLPKLIGGQESHGFPPGSYLLLAMLTFWPGSLLAGPALAGAWRHRADPVTRFLLTWLIPAWIVFEMIPTKLPHYVLPLYPALAAITAMQSVRWALQWRSDQSELPRRRALAIGWGIWSIATLALGAAIVAVPIVLDGGFDGWSAAPAAAVVASIVAGSFTFRRIDAAPAILALLVIGSAVLIAPTLAIILPQVESLWPSRAITRLVEAHEADEPASQPWAAVGYHEPSLVLALGGETRLLGPVRAAEALARGEVAGVLVEKRQRAVFESRAGELNLATETIGAVRAVNLSKGEWIELSVYVRASGQAGER